MSDVPLADTCVCGVPYWHRFVGTTEGARAESKFLWCRKCGAVRVIFEQRWQIPLDRAGEIASSDVPNDERPTRPGTPRAKRGEDDGGSAQGG